MGYKFEDIAFNSTAKRKPTVNDKNTYLGLEHLDSGKLTVTRFGSEVAPIGEKLIMKKGDILFGKRRAYQKKVAIAPFDGIFSAHGMVLRPKEAVIDKDFFPLFISSDYFLDTAIKISVGSLSPTINWRNLKELEFNLPPLDDQRRLAKILWSAVETRNAYTKLLAATEQLVKSQFIEMFGKPGSNEKGWELVRLKDCCEINPKKSNDKRLLNPELTVSFVPMPAVSETGIMDASVVRAYAEVKNGFTYFSENDVLFAKISPCMENGKGAIAKNLENGIGFGSTEFHVIRPLDGVSNPYWIYQITMFDQFRINAERVMTGTGGQRRVPVTYIENYVISLPPIELQNQFASFIRQVDKSKFELQRSVDDLESTYKSLLRENLG